MSKYTLEQLQNNLHIEYKDVTLLECALTHSSYANEYHTVSNERLEFMGDAVLDVLVSQYFYEKYPDYDEGALTKLRAKYVREEALYQYAIDIELDKYVLLGKGEDASGGRNRSSLLADAFEALFGSLYLDQGLDVTKTLFQSIIEPYLEDDVFSSKDYKSHLQEMVQSDKRSLTYKITGEHGPSHNKTFTATVYMDNIIMGEGKGKTKKEAEQSAAKKALDLLAVGE
jgi:ribonuclease-3